MVVLGFVSEPIEWDEDKYESKFGGRSLWLSEVSAPLSVACGVCGEPMPLLVQAYAPLQWERAQQRALHVFVCNSGRCIDSGLTQRARVFRSQEGVAAARRPALSADCSETIPVSADEFAWDMPIADWDDTAVDADSNSNSNLNSNVAAAADSVVGQGDADLDALLELRDVSLRAKEGRAEEGQMGRAVVDVRTRDGRKERKRLARAAKDDMRGAMSPAHSGPSEGHVEGDGGSRPPDPPIMSSSTSSASLIPPRYMEVALEPAEASATVAKEQLHHARQLADEYFSHEADALEQSHTATRGAQVQQSSNPGSGDGEQSESFGDEGYERPEASAHALLRFHKTLARSSDQCLRYDVGGSPVWMTTSTPPSGALPPCPNCGTHRHFEMQLMPPLLYYLQPQQSEDGGAVDASLEDGSSVASSTGLGMSWGTIAVYTCQQSCGDKGGCFEEICWVEPAE